MFCHACMVGTVCFFSWSNILVAAVEIFSLAKYSCSVGVHDVLSGMHNVHGLFISWCKILAQVGDIFELVEIFFLNWIADCFVSHAWWALSALFCKWKILFEAAGILSIFEDRSSIGLQIYLSSMHGVLCLFYFVINWIAVCFVKHTWCALSVLFC